MPNIQTTIAFAYDVDTVSTVVQTLAEIGALTQAQVDQAQRARITCNTNAINYTYDGTAPTTSAGHTIPTNGTVEIVGNQNIKNVKLIRSGGSNATVAVTLEK